MRAALYARVSTDQQEHEGTIQSQLAELRARLADDEVLDCYEFMDEGYSRDDVNRPSLDRLRDQVATRSASCVSCYRYMTRTRRLLRAEENLIRSAA